MTGDRRRPRPAAGPGAIPWSGGFVSRPEVPRGRHARGTPRPRRRTLDECRQLALDGDAVTRLVYAVVAAAQKEATNLKDALQRAVVLGDPA